MENAWHSVKHCFRVSTIFHTVIVFLPLSNDIGGSAYQAPDTHAYIVKDAMYAPIEVSNDSIFGYVLI